MRWSADMIGVEAFGLGVLASAFLFGFRHGIDWDHLAAITDITSSQDERRTSVAFGTIYALGHALVVFVIGTSAILLGEKLPEGVDAVMGRIVGSTLIVLGVFVFVSLIRHGREFRMRSRWMLLFSGVRSVYRKIQGRRGGAVDVHPHEPDEPFHVHDPNDEHVSVAVAQDVPVSQWHHGHHGRPGHHHHKHPEPDAFMSYGARTAFVVGMLHGVGAETPTQVLIFATAVGAGGRAAGEAVLVTFLIGLLISNSVITLGSAFGFLRASKNWTVYLTIAVVTGVFSLVVGTLLLLGHETVLPALFGG